LHGISIRVCADSNPENLIPPCYSPGNRGVTDLFLYQSLQIQAKQNEYNQTKQELALLQERNDQLQEHLDFYKGPGYLLYVEKVAREALNMVKPGETVVLASKPDGRGAPAAATTQQTAPAGSAAPTAAASATTGDQKTKTNWQNWLAFFVGQ